MVNTAIITITARATTHLLYFHFLVAKASRKNRNEMRVLLSVRSVSKGKPAHQGPKASCYTMGPRMKPPANRVSVVSFSHLLYFCCVITSNSV